MPYIEPSTRDKIDAGITIDSINAPGELAYAISKVINAFTDGNVCYTTIALVVGVLGTIQMEYYRKIASPYEDKKALRNGKVLW